MILEIYLFNYNVCFCRIFKYFFKYDMFVGRVYIKVYKSMINKLEKYCVFVFIVFCYLVFKIYND